jgi:hypothetical protein
MGFRINSTGRKRILREQISIRVTDPGNGQPASFTADIVLPPEMKLDPTAKVYVEPYAKTSTMRFAFGTVGAINPPTGCVLSDIDVGASVLFRVKVVDETGEVGRILASANGIHPLEESDDDKRRPLLPLHSENLDEEMWQLQFDKDGGPALVVNNRIPDLMNAVKNDAFVQGVIYPEIVRQMAIRVFGNGDEIDEEAEWFRDWHGWLLQELGKELGDYNQNDDEWVEALADDVAKAFARKNRFASTVIAARASSAT